MLPCTLQELIEQSSLLAKPYEAQADHISMGTAIGF